MVSHLAELWNHDPGLWLFFEVVQRYNDSLSSSNNYSGIVEFILEFDQLNAVDEVFVLKKNKAAELALQVNEGQPQEEQVTPQRLSPVLRRGIQLTAVLLQARTPNRQTSRYSTSPRPSPTRIPLPESTPALEDQQVQLQSPRVSSPVPPSPSDLSAKIRHLVWIAQQKRALEESKVRFSKLATEYSSWEMRRTLRISFGDHC